MDSFRVVRTDKGFTAIDNTIFFDRRVSLKARGLLCTCLSLPEGWAFSIRGLAEICRDGRDAVAAALTELEKLGYLRRNSVQGHREDGKFGGVEYVFYETPIAVVAHAEGSHAAETGETDSSPVCALVQNDSVGGGVCALVQNDSVGGGVCGLVQNDSVGGGVCGLVQNDSVGETAAPCTEKPCTEKPYTENPPQENKKQENKKYNTPLYPPKGGRRGKSVPEYEPEMFEAFWAAYPRGEDRQGAVSEWDKLRPDRALMQTMGAALRRQKETEEWQRGIGIPYAVRWLRRRRWEDVPLERPGTSPRASGYGYIPEEISASWEV